MRAAWRLNWKPVHTAHRPGHLPAFPASQPRCRAVGCLVHVCLGGVRPPGRRWPQGVRGCRCSVWSVPLQIRCAASPLLFQRCLLWDFPLALVTIPRQVRKARTSWDLASFGVSEAHACLLTGPVFSSSLPPHAEYIQKYATEEALKEQEEGTGDSSSESSMSDFSEDEAQDMEL